MSNEVDVVIKNYIDRIVDIFYYSGCILEILVCIVIISNLVVPRKRRSLLTGAYFYILFWNYLFDALYELGFTCQRYFTKDWSSDNAIDIPFFKYFECFIEWYIMLFMGLSNVLLSLNRFTSIFSINKHKIIWTKYFWIILSLLLFYPFIIHGYSFGNIKCRFDTYAPECSEYIKEDVFVRCISNGICAIISLIIGIATFILYRIKFRSQNIQQQSKQIKIEYKLLIQSVWSASMFGLYAVLTLYFPLSHETKDDPNFWLFNRIYGIIFDFSYIAYHYATIIMLFFFSKALRDEFLKMYHLEYIAEKLFHIQTSRVKSATTTLAVPSFAITKRQSLFPKY